MCIDVHIWGDVSSDMPLTRKVGDRAKRAIGVWGLCPHEKKVLEINDDLGRVERVRDLSRWESG